MLVVVPVAIFTRGTMLTARVQVATESNGIGTGVSHNNPGQSLREQRQEAPSIPTLNP